jgi:FkbM family methyltransferase
LVSLDHAVRRALLNSPPTYALVRRARVVARFVARVPHEPDFAAFAFFGDRQGLFLDIGANTGQSALAFRLFHRAPILSLEPNPLHDGDLRFVRRLIGDFDFLPVAAGERNGAAVLRVPTVRGVEVTGEGTLGEPCADDDWARQQVGAPGGTGVTEHRVQVRRLDDLALAPSFVKLDIEGAEGAALRGLARTLRLHRPIVLVERSESFAEVRGQLEPLGYTCHRYDPAARRLEPADDPRTQNVFFLP